MNNDMAVNCDKYCGFENMPVGLIAFNNSKI